jgi:hypothetical protein
MSFGRRRVVIFGVLVWACFAFPSFAIIHTNVRAAQAEPAINFSATPDDIATGENSTLVWDTTDADSVTIDNGVGSQPVSGSLVVHPTLTTTYTLTATGPGGTSTSQATVMVTNRPVISFIVNPTDIVSGSAATLYWSVSNSRGVLIDNGIGLVPESGSIAVFPTTTTTYTLTALGAQEDSFAEVTVNVVEVPQILTFTATPSTISPGDTVTIEWSVSGVDFVTIDPIGDEFADGSVDVSPAKTTVYRITAKNEAGTATATVTVTVTVPTAPTPPKRRAVKH